MGRYYSVTTKVIRGSQIGQKVGVPTANLLIKEDFVDVKPGVYAVKVTYNKESYLGVCNIGHNPSFNYQASKRIEVHILEFDKNIYEDEITVEFLEYLRSEQVFESIGLFKEQIAKDIFNTKKYQNLI